ncbi:Uncharacterised protein [Chlamydia abortus]|nr:Uncharacterised protein [Chlamydia abortus]
MNAEIQQAHPGKTALVGGAPQQQKVVVTSAPAFVPKAQVTPGVRLWQAEGLLKAITK